MRWARRPPSLLTGIAFNALPNLTEAPKEQADIAWLVYDLDRDRKTNRLVLKSSTVFTSFSDSLRAMTHVETTDGGGFISDLQQNLDGKLSGATASALVNVELPHEAKVGLETLQEVG